MEQTNKRTKYTITKRTKYTITKTFTLQYDKGDIVIFKKNSSLFCGEVIGYSINSSADENVIWYNIDIRNEKSFITNCSVYEIDIIGKITDFVLSRDIKEFIYKGIE